MNFFFLPDEQNQKQTKLLFEFLDNYFENVKNFVSFTFSAFRPQGSQIFRKINCYFLRISATVVIIFEIILNATSMFNHGNVRFPAQIDRISRLVVVTPEIYRVQHSVIIKELNSNFGFNLPWWDRFLGTSRPT